MKSKSRVSRNVYAISDRIWYNKHLRHTITENIITMVTTDFSSGSPLWIDPNIADFVLQLSGTIGKDDTSLTKISMHIYSSIFFSGWICGYIFWHLLFMCIVRVHFRINWVTRSKASVQYVLAINAFQIFCSWPNISCHLQMPWKKKCSIQFMTIPCHLEVYLFLTEFVHKYC